MAICAQEDLYSSHYSRTADIGWHVRLSRLCEPTKTAFGGVHS
jgi:hypothetical protein